MTHRKEDLNSSVTVTPVDYITHFLYDFALEANVRKKSRGSTLVARECEKKFEYDGSSIKSAYITTRFVYALVALSGINLVA